MKELNYRENWRVITRKKGNSRNRGFTYPTMCLNRTSLCHVCVAASSVNVCESVASRGYSTPPLCHQIPWSGHRRNLHIRYRGIGPAHAFSKSVYVSEFRGTLAECCRLFPRPLRILSINRILHAWLCVRRLMFL